MEKCIKKSNLKQLQLLVEYMEANPEFGRGSAVFGSSKHFVEEQWIKLTRKLNAFGPPVRTIVEWKKTWTDLKSRTKKKIAENKKSLNETGGGLYRVNSLTELEQIVDRTLFLSKAAAPSGKVFGYNDKASPKNVDSIESCFIPIADTPPRSSKATAIVTPSRQAESKEKIEKRPTQQLSDFSPLLQRGQKRQREGDEGCSSTKKKKKTLAEEQIFLIRRQLQLGEKSAAVAKQHSDAAVLLAEATKAIADAAKKIAEAAEIQAAAAKTNSETNSKILLSLEKIANALAEKEN